MSDGPDRQVIWTNRLDTDQKMEGINIDGPGISIKLAREMVVKAGWQIVAENVGVDPVQPGMGRVLYGGSGSAEEYGPLVVERYSVTKGDWQTGEMTRVEVGAPLPAVDDDIARKVENIILAAVKGDESIDEAARAVLAIAGPHYRNERDKEIAQVLDAAAQRLGDKSGLTVQEVLGEVAAAIRKETP